MNKIEQLQKLIDQAKNIVVITGAGISTASGIPDIRSENGAANNKDLLKKYHYDYETIVSHSFFIKHTDEFFRYYKEQMIFGNAKPNVAHHYLSNLEKDKNVTIITQNIDGLHTVAGSKHVIEFHGSVQRNTCMDCGEKYPLSEILNQIGVPHCKCGGIIKPDVVLFEEGIDTQVLIDSVNATEKADLLLIIGSSLVVYPAAAIPNYFFGDNIVIINKNKTPLDGRAKLVINDDIVAVFKQLH